MGIKPSRGGKQVAKILHAADAAARPALLTTPKARIGLIIPSSNRLAEPRAAVTPEADGLFLSCTNTTQIEIIEQAEEITGLPIVTSNQAVMWWALRELAAKLGGSIATRGTGRLFQTAS